MPSNRDAFNRMASDEKVSVSDIQDYLDAHPEHELDLSNPQPHNWVDRGLKMSCEGAGHPMHQVWKRHKPISV